MNDHMSPKRELLDFLAQIEVTPSARTLLLIDVDPNMPIEECFGEETARKWSKREMVYLGNFPVGYVRLKSVLSDMENCGYKRLGFFDSKPEETILFQSAVSEHGVDNILTVSDYVLGGHTTLNGRPYNTGEKINYFLRPGIAQLDK